MALNLEPVYQSIEAAAAPRDREFFLDFAHLLFEKAGVGFLSLFDTEDLAAIARSSLRFVDRRRKEEIKVRVYNPTPGRHGWKADFTVVEILLQDRPFVVDSMPGCLASLGLELVDFLHPVIRVRRDGTGKLHRVRPQRDESTLEAYELFLLRQVERSRYKAIKKRVRDVLGDVVLASTDYPSMKHRAVELRDSLIGLATAAGTHLPFKEGPVDLREYASFIEWLLADNFVFLGYREYDIFDRKGGRSIQTRPGSGLGILRKMESSAYLKATPLEKIPEKLRERMTAGPVLMVTKTNAESTVHRPVRMDYIGVKVYDESGRPAGERRLLGLFTSRAHSTSVELIPLLRRKLKQVLTLDGAVEGSHDFKQVVAIFNSIPRDELFWSSSDQLHKDIRTIIGIERQRRIRLTVRPDPLGRGLALMVIMPRDRFSTKVRQRIQGFLAQQLQADHVDYHLAMGEDEAKARLHFFFTTELTIDSVDLPGLDRQIAEFTRSWKEHLLDEMLKRHHRSEARRLVDGYGQAFEEGYRAEMPVEQAARDIENLETLGDAPYLVELVARARGSDRVVSTQVRIYHQQSTLVLSEVFPILENLGLRIIEQISYSPDGSKVLPEGSRNPSLGIDIFRVLDHSGTPIDVDRLGHVLTEALLELLYGRAANDRLNQLVLTSGMSIRQVALLRTCRAYLSQVQAATSLSFVADALLKHPGCARAIYKFFEARFGPSSNGSRKKAVAKARSAFYEQLAPVSSLSEDETLGTLFQIVEATVRTSFFLNDPRIALKIDSSKVPVMPDPRPLFEIFMSSPDMEGIHLRGGRVARGGIRWSDRPDDFRTEVLGLMKTQMTKNAVIVPVGSKGGFVLKHPPAERTQLREHVREQYKTFIRGLLDLTDNLVEGEIVHPRGLVIYDERDPYLVVAADKGTARFSDLANQISHEYRFWLGDAFASGGSHGYDHKQEAITARGAWECVRRHFREIGIRFGQQVVTVAGIGDMSGDVFGNGMLYSDRIKLLAAFNHLHIFLDPNPDPQASFRERRRLFETPGSTWEDYDPKLISRGGRVYSRHAKSIKLSAAARKMLGTREASLSGRALIRAILKMEVDLLWNGGIGTYVKSSSERQGDVGDQSNDNVRVDASQIQARVVGEGGNLGFTQLGRIEYALKGGRVNTDAIDNSAGVDMSDHEVNIKILLQLPVEAGSLSFEERNQFLESMTDDVSKLVLEDNYSQSLCLSLAEKRSREDLSLFESLQEHLRDRGDLDPVVESLPSSRTYRERAAQHLGLTRPELAVLLAYTKMALTEHLLLSDLPDQEFVQHYLSDYFPARLMERYSEWAQGHRLRREIIACQLTNLVVDKVGIAFIHGMIRDTGATPPEVVQAAVAALVILDLGSFLKQIFALDDRVTATSQYRALGEVDRAVRGIVQWILLGDVDLDQLTEFVEHHRPPMTEVRKRMARFLPRAEKTLYSQKAQEFVEDSFPKRLAGQVASLDYLPASMGLITASDSTPATLEEAARAFYALGDKLHLGAQRDAIFNLPKKSKWEKIAATSLIMDLRSVQRQLTIEFLKAREKQEGLSMDGFLERDSRTYDRFEQAVWDLESDPETALTKAGVVTRMLIRMTETARRLNQAAG